MFWKDGYSKKIALEYDLSCRIFWKDDTFFPENVILFFRRKMKDDLSPKNTWKYDISFKCPEKTVFQKNCSGIWSFLYYLKRWCIFFPENMIPFLWTENERWSFSRNTWAYDIFCIYVWMLQTWYYPSAKKKKKKKKNQRWSSPKKNTLKGNWHSRSFSSNKLPTISKYSNEISESAWSSFEYPTS